MFALEDLERYAEEAGLPADEPALEEDEGDAEESAEEDTIAEELRQSIPVVAQATEDVGRLQLTPGVS